jgi:phosphohistidine phosphatase
MKMQLLVIRHAIAEEQVEFERSGRPDDLRPLTASGKKRMRRATPALKRLVPSIDVLTSSPLVRARQTAEIVARSYPELHVETLAGLAPDARLPVFLHWLRGRAAGETVAAVGHEPHLSHLVSWLLAGRFTSFVRLQKGAACLLAFHGEPAPGEAELQWLLQPRQLRHLSR